MRFPKMAFTTAGSALFSLDLLLVAVLWPAALSFARPASLAPGLEPWDIRVVAYPAANFLFLYSMGMYRRDALMDQRRTAGRIPLVVLMGATLGFICPVLVALFVSNAVPHYGGRDQAMMFGLAILVFILAAYFARAIFETLMSLRVLHRRLLVVGAGQRAYDLMHMLTREGSNLHYDIVFVDHPPIGDIDPRLSSQPGVRIIRMGEGGVLEMAQSTRADEIVVAPDDRRGMDLQRLLDCKTSGYPVVDYLTFVENELRRIDIKRIEIGWLVFSDGFTYGAVDRFLKRVFDLVVSLAVLLVGAIPLIFGMVAIRFEGPGPIFYRQERVTRGGKVFWILKLRTMRTDAESSGAVWAATGDSRITKVGNFLRRTRIDELPQLLNILKGEMSFVGPRPERPIFVAELAEKIPLYNERHIVKAGLTGWAQVNYPYGASVDDARSKLSYDLYYVKNFSILFDFAILLQTLREVLWPSGAR